MIGEALDWVLVLVQAIAMLSLFLIQQAMEANISPFAPWQTQMSLTYTHTCCAISNSYPAMRLLNIKHTCENYITDL